MKSKIVQMTVTHRGMIVLCEDGSLWRLDFDLAKGEDSFKEPIQLTMPCADKDNKCNYSQ